MTSQRLNHYLTKLPGTKEGCHIKSVSFTNLLGRFCLFFVRLFLVGLGRILLCKAREEKRHFSVAGGYNELRNIPSTCIFFPHTKNQCMKSQEGSLKYAQSYISIRNQNTRVACRRCCISQLLLLYSVH